MHIINRQRTSSSTTTAEQVVVAPPMFGLRFWMTCCFVSVVHHAFYFTFSDIIVSSPTSSVTSFPLLQHQQHEDGIVDAAGWSPTAVAVLASARSAAAATGGGRFAGESRALRGTTLVQPEQQQPQQAEEEPQPIEPEEPQIPPFLPPPLTDPSAVDAVAVAVATESDTSNNGNIAKKNEKSLSSPEEAEYWSKNGCLYVENLCHSTYQFFYDAPGNAAKEKDQFFGEMDHDSSPYQPHLELDLQSIFARGYPTNIQIGRGRPQGLQQQTQTCHYSPISHHLMFSTPFNHMMVEFYIRTMTGLRPILQNHPVLRTSPGHVQTYVILYNFAKILDGHRLFTNTLPTSNPLLPFQALLDSTHCTCMAKAVFCGFKRATKKDPALSTVMIVDDEEPSSSSATATTDKAAANETAPTATENIPAATTTTTAVLRPFADIGGMGIYREKRRYPGLRKHVRTELFDGDNQLISEMVKDYRLSQIRRIRGDGQQVSEEQVDDYILIGLTQRTGRRRWSNLNKVLSNCNTYAPFVQAKIICIEVNMDNASSHVLQQAVIHGSLQAFVGIHGSHFVNAVMLPKGATILEFQPWFPDWMRFGREWARRTDIATPVGSMFFNSDLNHVGLALERSSAPQLCSNYTMGSVEDDECLYALSETDHDAIWWGTRDFSISWSVVQSFILQFMMPGASKPDTCDDFKRIQSEHMITMEGTNRSQSFSLYSVNCRDTPTSQRVHTWHSYNNYTLEEEARLKVLVQEGMDKPPSKRKTASTQQTTSDNSNNTGGDIKDNTSIVATATV